MLSAELDIPFFDADDFHPASNIEKMARGNPLDDEDRQPWLETLAARLSAWEREGGAVLACSALNERYRKTLSSQCSAPPRWLMLHAPEEVIAERLVSRKGHFLGQALLKSQLDTLEIPDYGWTFDATASPQEIVNEILTRLRSE